MDSGSCTNCLKYGYVPRYYLKVRIEPASSHDRNQPRAQTGVELLCTKYAALDMRAWNERTLDISRAI